MVWRFIRRWWWVFAAGAAGLGTTLFYLFLANRSDYPEQPRSDFRDRAQKEVERVRLEGEIEKAKVTVRAETQHEELTRIEELGKEDPVEARKRLSSWLNNHL